MFISCDCDQYLTRNQGRAFGAHSLRVRSTMEGQAWLQEVPFMYQECRAGNHILSHFGKTGSKEGPKMCPGIKSQALPLVMDFLRGAPLSPEDAQALKVPQPSKTTAPAGHQVLKQAWEGHFTFKLQKASVKNWDKGSYSLPYFLGNRDSAGSNSELFMGQASILPLSRSSARSFLESAV